jgi:hypothetical protein
MDHPGDDLLCELFDAGPHSPAAAAERWRAASAAVASVCPELVGANGAALEEARVLRIAFTAIDLFVFRTSFMALFTLCGGTYWAWRLDCGDGPLDAWVEDSPWSETVLEDGFTFTRHETLYEFVLNRRRLAEAHPTGGGPPGRFDDHDADTVIDAVVGALGRRMLRLAAVETAASRREIDETAARLLRVFGTGPPPVARGDGRA